MTQQIIEQNIAAAKSTLDEFPLSSRKWKYQIVTQPDGFGIEFDYIGGNSWVEFDWNTYATIDEARERIRTKIIEDNFIQQVVEA